MSNRTPTIEEGERAYIDGLSGTSRTREESAAEFDRMIAAVEREAAEKAVREMAEYLTVKTVDPAYEGQGNDGEFGSGFYQGIRSCRRALRARAEAYRQERNNDERD